MEIIGLIGGMSWESTAAYYRIINETVKRELGGLHSAQILLYSVDFAEIEKCQARGEWEKSAAILIDAASRLEKAGASFLVICTNTMHRVADQIEQSVSIPLMHIAVETARALREQGIKKAALLGTTYTMTQDFYKNRLRDARIEVLIPEEKDRQLINDVIYKELCLGRVSKTSKHKFLDIIEKLRQRGAGAVILGCTEIGMLIGQEDVDLPVFDTTLIHAQRAALLALEKDAKGAGHSLKINSRDK